MVSSAWCVIFSFPKGGVVVVLISHGEWQYCLSQRCLVSFNVDKCLKVCCDLVPLSLQLGYRRERCTCYGILGDSPELQELVIKYPMAVLNVKVVVVQVIDQNSKR